MLQHLSVRNLAIIDQLDIEFQKGLNIISGETGSGKSILVQALELISGSRATTDLIRTGEEECEVSAVFDLLNAQKTIHFLNEKDYLTEDQLIIRRTFNSSGKSKVWINDRLATVAFLHDLQPYLLEIVGQHASQELLVDEMPRVYLDSFGNDDSLLRDYQKQYHHYFKLLSDFRELQSQNETTKSKEDFYRFQWQEIEQANLKKGEEEDLTQEKKILSHFSKIHESVSLAELNLYSSDRSIIELLGKIEIAFQKISEIDPALDEKLKIIQNLSFEVEELSRFFQTYLQKNSFDPERLDLIESRLDEINKIKKKYGGSIETVLEKKNELSKQLTLLENFEDSIKNLQIEIDLAKKELEKNASLLTQTRKKNAKILSKKIQEELKTVSMNQVSFEIKISPENDFTLNGLDQIEFFISTNKGESLKPLAQIASGGELSRVHLILKTILKNNPIGTYLFDEVDTGIGGAVAEQVGEKLKSLSKNSQIICITHLPQIAACADAHFQIQKIEKKERTITQVRFLEIEERIREVARMFAGAHITHEALSHAKEMIHHQKLLSHPPLPGREGLSKTDR